MNTNTSVAESGTVREVRVELGDERSYSVHVGRGSISALESLIPDSARSVAVVTQAGIPHSVATDRRQRVFTIGDGEQHKSLTTIEELCEAFAEWGLTRADCVIGLGGGLVTDVAGFAASVYHRGLAVVHVATTLLGQVDAAIGGKTGVNLPAGKNLVGTYWQPDGVICDTAMLDTLGEREWLCGMGEVAKYHWLGGGRLDELDLDDRVEACVRIKAQVVAADERESSRRALLNYGHTLAHAIEIAGGHELRHGEAVAVGLVFASELARTMGRIDDEAVAEHRRVVAGYGLPTRLPEGMEDEMLLQLMAHDKKVLGADLTFVLDGPHGLEVVDGIEPDLVASVLEAVR